MKKCIVIGGGLAGLSASVYLSKNNFNVHLIEASPKLGGRTYSFRSSKHDDEIDNGQHIMMGCYDYTLEYLYEIDALDRLDVQKKLNVNFVAEGGEHFQLTTSDSIYPLNLMSAVKNYKILSLSEQLKVLDFFGDLYFLDPKVLGNQTVKEWLKEKHQSENIIKALWEILAIGTLNTTLEKASAETFAVVLKKIFFGGKRSSSIVLPKTGLSTLFCEPAEKFLVERGNKFSLSEKVTEIKYSGNKVEKIITDKNEYSDFDFIVSALPLHALSRIDNSLNPIKGDEKYQFEYSPILNVHIWLKENPFEEKFYGLVDSKIHWLFNHGEHITLVTSAADELIELSNEELIDLILCELEKYFSIFNKDLFIDYKIIKEKRATFIPDPPSNEKRESIEKKFENLIYAGDWVNTGLPSTIESAIKSGKIAADVISGYK